MSNTSEDQIWQEISAERALELFNENLSEAGISEIKIPSGLSRDLMVTESAWQIATDPDINPMTPYMWGLGNSLFDSEANGYLHDDRDFFIAGHNGHGINSYAFGIVSRVGSVTVAQQQHFGGIYGDASEDLESVNEQIRIWNNGLWELEQLRKLPANPLLVEFSSFRDFARISEWQERDSKWSIVIDALDSRVQAEMLLMDQDIKHQHLRASASHLIALLQADSRMWQQVFPDAELHASVKESDNKTVHSLFLATPTMYLVRKDKKWEWASNEDNEAADGDLQVRVNSKFISFFDDAQELGAELKVKDLNDYRLDDSLEFDTSSDLSISDQGLKVDEATEVATNDSAARVIEVFATVDVQEFNDGHIVLGVWLSRPDYQEITGTMKFKFKHMGDAVDFLINKLHIKLTVFDGEDLESLKSVRVIADFKAAESYFEQLHGVLRLEEEDLWHSYKGPPIGYGILDLTS